MGGVLVMRLSIELGICIALAVIGAIIIIVPVAEQTTLAIHLLSLAVGS